VAGLLLSPAAAAAAAAAAAFVFHSDDLFNCMHQENIMHD
jgi:cytochrome c oxidase assembly factor CtaG